MPKVSPILLLAAVLWSASELRAADAPELDTSAMLRLPDLTPSLSTAEVTALLGPWIEDFRQKLAKMEEHKKEEAKKAPESNIPTEEQRKAGITAEFLAAAKADQERLDKQIPAALRALRAVIPKVDKVTFYSLVPAPEKYFNSLKGYSGRLAELKKLPRFHDFPILGSVTLDHKDEANRWADFFREQTYGYPGFTSCDFAPRHGMRFTIGKKNFDFLMCYKCNELAITGDAQLEPKPDPLVNLVFTTAVKEVLNALFDKRLIERDRPWHETKEADP